MTRFLAACRFLLVIPVIGCVLLTAGVVIIDLFLVGTVAYIAAIGVYKLFISDAETKLPMSSKINTLKDLD